VSLNLNIYKTYKYKFDLIKNNSENDRAMGKVIGRVGELFI
jgi:hypothetical protein